MALYYIIKQRCIRCIANASLITSTFDKMTCFVFPPHLLIQQLMIGNPALHGSRAHRGWLQCIPFQPYSLVSHTVQIFYYSLLWVAGRRSTTFSWRCRKEQRGPSRSTSCESVNFSAQTRHFIPPGKRTPSAVISGLIKLSAVPYTYTSKDNGRSMHRQSGLWPHTIYGKTGPDSMPNIHPLLICFVYGSSINDYTGSIEAR